MFLGRWTSWRAANNSGSPSRFTIRLSSMVLLVSPGLLAGCGESGSTLADIYANHEPSQTWAQIPSDAATPAVQLVVHQDRVDRSADPHLAALVPMADYLRTVDVHQQPQTYQKKRQNSHWPITSDDDTPQIPPAFAPLPAGKQFAVKQATPFQALFEAPPQPAEDSSLEQPIGFLLPPQPIVQERTKAGEPTVESATEDVTEIPSDTVAPRGESTHKELAPVQQLIEASAEPDEVSSLEQSIGDLFPRQPIVHEETKTTEPNVAVSNADSAEVQTETLSTVEEAPLPALAALSQQEQMLARLLRDSSSATTGVLTDSRVNDLAKTKIQHAYAKASRGSLYVARQELIEVLRMISQAKDAQHGSPDRSNALAAGLRALREAEDFAPSGTQLEAELDIMVLCASHRTPVSKQPGSADLLPRLMMDRYLRYAQLQLAMSAAGEPAGSMALHALGKINSQLGRVEPAQHSLADRHAVAFQQAALLAHNQNHLAAHELGVLLANSGHFAEAEQLLLQVAARESNAVVYRNLARIQEQLGQPGPALANREFARLLSQHGGSLANNVQWVSPDQFAQGSLQSTRYRTAQSQAANPYTVPGGHPRGPHTVRR